jgi:tRNA-dihydrouridine synthase
MQNFWHNLPTPFFCLAPMEEVTDVSFREMFAKYSKTGESVKGKGGSLYHQGDFSIPSAIHPIPYNPFLMFTEFVNVDGLTHPEGYKKLSVDLKFTEAQRPIVAQIWGTDPEKFYQASQIISKLGFDGIDINMGCPQEKEVNIGACAALINTPNLALEIISATKKVGLPVSVKTRIGYHKIQTEEWVGTLLSSGISALTLHGRTKKEMSKVPAHWEEIKKAVEVRNKMFPLSPHPLPSPKGRGKEVGLRSLIIGNGDIKTRKEGLIRIQETGCDGVMIGRGAFGNPWLFRDENYKLSISEKLRVMLEHAYLFKKWLPEKHFPIMRKHFKAYASGFDGAGELRAKLMEAKNLEETKSIVNEYLQNNS